MDDPLGDPSTARVFIVGRNQATGFPADKIDHDRFIDAHFNRNGRTCRQLYNGARAFAGKTGDSPARKSTDKLVKVLNAHGVDRVLETNVICYSTPMSSDLVDEEHQGGRERGTELFEALLHLIAPSVLIAHGSGTVRDLERLLGIELTSPPKSSDDAISCATAQKTNRNVYVIPSLAPPGWNKWAGWAPAYFERLAAAVALEMA